ncbi:MAG: MazG-like family protein [Gemmatimonadaceae bacterium]|nr:MazG-like family protein [Gemmatimonadaceae bacterium]
MSLTFRDFQMLNRLRCEEGFGHPVAVDEPSWPLQNWALAIAGEAGELCNLIKKTLRGDFTIEEKRGEILAELADVMTYCDLATSAMEADTGETVMAKFDVVSKRIGWVKP